jgi:hypothetical protein
VLLFGGGDIGVAVEVTGRNCLASEKWQRGSPEIPAPAHGV